MDLQGTVKQDMHVLVDDCDVDMNVKIEEHSIQVNPEIKQEIEPYSEVPVPGISQIIPCKSPLVSTNHYQCPHCNIKIHKQTLKKHLQMRTDEKAHRCSHCGKWFASRYHMLWHMKSHTAQSHKTYQCCYCDKSFSSDRNMAQHQRIHTDEKQHQGSQIEEKVTEKSTEKPYQCGHCDKRFPFLYHLINHQNAGKSYKCIMCGKKFYLQRIFCTTPDTDITLWENVTQISVYIL
ncbi:unnamed protein product [Meganyctiphanes norvegica]|uniref:Zinc finger protein unc-98 n=1 Tax=Meganyctiphanes norvegica TaxID=48144 RepID=A0AAV2SKT1_MEGNR